MEGLTLTTLLGAAAVDSINPCTLAILIILLSTLITIDKRHKVLGAGLAFSFAIFISYFLMGLGVYSALATASSVHYFYYFVIFLAFFIGLLSIKDYFYYKPGFWAVEIPASWRPRLKRMIARVTSVPGAALVGLFCSLFLIPCSSGPYLVILSLIAKNKLEAIPLLLLYNFIFILPMIIITLLIYYSLLSIDDLQEWRERNIKKLHLISGIIMILLGFLLLFFS